MDSLRFRRRVALVLGAFILFMTAFPHLLLSLVKASSCEHAAGACGAVAAVGGIYLKSLVLLATFAALMALAFFRCKALGMSRWWLLALLGWLAGCWSYLFAAGNFWGASFGVGILRVNPPILLVACAAFLAFLCVDTSPSERRMRTSTRIGWGTAALAGAHASLSPLLSLLTFTVLFQLPSSKAAWRTAIFIQQHGTTLSNLGLNPLLVQWTDVTVFGGALLSVLLTRDRGTGSTAYRGEAIAR